jgi:hypothetical protein
MLLQQLENLRPGQVIDFNAHHLGYESRPFSKVPPSA